MTPLVVDPSGYLKPHHSVGHCQFRGHKTPGKRLVGWPKSALLNSLLVSCLGNSLDI